MRLRRPAKASFHWLKIGDALAPQIELLKRKCLLGCSRFIPEQGYAIPKPSAAIARRVDGMHILIGPAVSIQWILSGHRGRQVPLLAKNYHATVGRRSDVENSGLRGETLNCIKRGALENAQFFAPRKGPLLHPIPLGHRQ